MTEQDWQNVIMVMRRSPLANMDEAEFVSALCTKLAEYVKSLQQPQGSDED